MILFVPASRVSGLIDLSPDGIGSKPFGKQSFSLESKKNRRMGELGVVVHTCDTSSWELGEGDNNSKACLSYKVNSRLA